MIILLVDNGSSRAASTLQLRKVAKALSKQAKEKIYPVSLKHADKAPSDELNGEPTNLFTSFLEMKLQEGFVDFIVLPLFFGKSRAITSYMVDEISKLKLTYKNLNVHIAKELYPLPAKEPLLSEIIYDNLVNTLSSQNCSFSDFNDSNLDEKIKLVLVDHGSPLRAVTQVRESIVLDIQKKLPQNIQLEQAVMERRAGREYEFNGVLLEDYLNALNSPENIMVFVVMLFLLPGTHAGEGGDIAVICKSAKKRNSKISIFLSPLVSENEKIVDLLQKRLDCAINN